MATAKKAPAKKSPASSTLAKRQLYLTMCELFQRFPNVELAEEPEKDAGDHNAIVFKKLMLRTNCH